MRILIAGASRGIGREMARQCTAKGWVVHGTARSQAARQAMEADGQKTHLLDIADQGSIEALACELKGTSFDAIVVNAGISGDQDMPTENITFDEMSRVFETNTFGPVRLIRALKANLLSSDRRLALAMSSLMSSISSNDWSTQHSYRASKTALNAAWRSLQEEWAADGACCVLLRPGFVKTDMTNHQGLDVSVSVAGMVNVIDNLTVSDGGRMIGYDGLDVPW
jgi:NAD(P)-dependent dehydrogenase (short-subunit alcohol dehydrogenase family)